jgi:hypothetical protein
VLNGSNEVETSSLKGIGKVCKGSNQEYPAPKGAFDFEELAVSLKRYPDTKPARASDFVDFDVSLKQYRNTKPEFFSSLQKKTDCVKVTKES